MVKNLGGNPMRGSKHLKFALTLAMVFVFTLSSFTGVYARRADDPIPVFDFVKGIEEEIQPIKYSNKDLTIKGKALKGTKIDISTFWYKPNNEKTIIHKNKPIDGEADDSLGEWILQANKSCKVGISGIFGVSVTIKPGKNKIVVEAGDGSSYELEVEYVNNEEITEKINNILFKDLDLEIVN